MTGHDPDDGALLASLFRRAFKGALLLSALLVLGLLITTLLRLS